jgi:NADH-quinone oxidoreductase subunit J
VTVPVVLFYAFAVLAIVSALGMVLNVRNTVAAAMSLVVTMIALAGIYLLLDAYLVAVIQIIVYAGAIVVLFLFVVMLLNLRHDTFAPGRQWLVKAGALLLSLVVLSELLRLFRGGLPAPPAEPAPPGFGGYHQVGIALYTDYVLLVEMASLLLLAAIVGALILAKRKID